MPVVLDSINAGVRVIIRKQNLRSIQARDKDMQNEVKDLKRRLQAARQRAAYWSGRPSGRGFGYNPNANNGRDADMEYEMAISDCNYLASRIEIETGKRPRVTDYKDEFITAFFAAMCRT